MTRRIPSLLLFVAMLAPLSADAAETKRKCPACHDTGKVPCDACRYMGKPTGKTLCDACGGKGRVTCPDCGGSCGIKCSYCGGTGRVKTGKTKTFTKAFRSEQYEKCRHCAGTGMVHYIKGKEYLGKQPGPCPTCYDRNLPNRLRGTVRCEKCHGTKWSGVCEKCKGTKLMPCPLCQAREAAEAKAKAEAKRKAAKCVTAEGESKLPNISSDFKLPAAGEAAKAYSKELNQAQARYTQALAALQAEHEAEVVATLRKAVTRLKAAMTKATQAGDLDEAIKIRDTIRTLEAAIAEHTGKGPDMAAAGK